jgi:hypothetical protein
MFARSAALGVGAASFFVFHKKDTAENPTPIFLRGNAQIFESTKSEIRKFETVSDLKF